jgi:hypothetical protein
MPDNEINSISILFEVGKESSNELQICVSALHGHHEADSSLNRSRRREYVYNLLTPLVISTISLSTSEYEL